MCLGSHDSTDKEEDSWAVLMDASFAMPPATTSVEAELAALVSRDSMVGTAVATAPGLGPA